MKYFKLFAALIIGAALSSCASKSFKELESHQFEQASKTLDITFHKQRTNECGPISLYTITQFFNSPASFEQIKSMAYTPVSNGSHKSDMLATARRIGFAPYKLENLPQALNAIGNNYPVLVFQNLGLSLRPTWHYSVLVGYDANTSEVSLHDGKTAYSKQTFKRFANAWERGDKWAYIIAPAKLIPVQADFQQVMVNAQVFADIKKSESAIELLLSAKKRWPKRYEIDTALSNRYFSEKRLDLAQKHASNAIALNPKHPGLHYNLAYIQVHNNQRERALSSKRAALKLVQDANERTDLEAKFAAIGL